MKEDIPSPELEFIKRKTRQTKAEVIKTAASTSQKRLQKEIDERDKWEKKIR